MRALRTRSGRKKTKPRLRPMHCHKLSVRVLWNRSYAFASPKAHCLMRTSKVFRAGVGMPAAWQDRAVRKMHDILSKPAAPWKPTSPLKLFTEYLDISIASLVTKISNSQKSPRSGLLIDPPTTKLLKRDPRNQIYHNRHDYGSQHDKISQHCLHRESSPFTLIASFSHWTD
jgi:hypothetical protein